MALAVAEDYQKSPSQSASMQRINEILTELRKESMQLDRQEATVLILGELGTEKEEIARQIHSSSRRGRGPWIQLNCMQELVDAKSLSLYCEQAAQGTLFLNDVDLLTLPMQDQLGTILASQSHFRVIFASNSSSKPDTGYGSFAKVILEIPPLRQRGGDLVTLAIQVAERVFRTHGRKFSGFSRDAQTALLEYDWPGNVEELTAVLERAFWLCIRKAEFPLTAGELFIPHGTRGSGTPKLELVPNHSSEGYMAIKKKWAATFEREYLLASLNRNGGNVSAAAREAKLDRSNFLRLLRRYRLSAQGFRKAA